MSVYAKSARSAVIAPSEVDTVVEHEHHHVHHHIDHGNMQLAPRPRSNYGGYDDFEDDRTVVSRSVRSNRERDSSRYHTHTHRHGGSTRYSRSEYEVTVNNSSSRRGSVQQQAPPREGTSDWTIVDVPPGTRRITVDIAPQPEPEPEPEVVHEVCRDVKVSRYNGIRRSKGVSSELWTEITKDLVCREAIEDMQFQFEETDYFYYIFEYLNKDQINELIELSAAIRRERAKELQYDHISRHHTHTHAHNHSSHNHVIEHRDHTHIIEHSTPRYIEAMPAPPPPPPVQERPEIVYTEEQTRRKSRKYYY